MDANTTDDAAKKAAEEAAKAAEEKADVTPVTEATPAAEEQK